MDSAAVERRAGGEQHDVPVDVAHGPHVVAHGRHRHAVDGQSSMVAHVVVDHVDEPAVVEPLRCTRDELDPQVVRVLGEQRRGAVAADAADLHARLVAVLHDEHRPVTVGHDADQVLEGLAVPLDRGDGPVEADAVQGAPRRWRCPRRGSAARRARCPAAPGRRSTTSAPVRRRRVRRSSAAPSVLHQKPRVRSISSAATKSGRPQVTVDEDSSGLRRTGAVLASPVTSCTHSAPSCTNATRRPEGSSRGSMAGEGSSSRSADPLARSTRNTEPPRVTTAREHASSTE